MLYTPQLEQHVRELEQWLGKCLPGEDGLQGVVSSAMRYACEAGGKRLRPVLTMEFCRLSCGESARALPFATAVELIHAYSLVHDDLPCMDNSLLRRGKPSTHAKYGENMALLAGDALLTRAFEVMLSPQNRRDISAENAMNAAYILAEAAGIEGMVGGQTIDLCSEGLSIDLYTLEQLQTGKTAALIEAACAIGCLAGDAGENQIQAARTFGKKLGLCFQVVDDILDVTATADQLGKPTNSDMQNQKTTYVSLLGKEAAQALARQYTDDAVMALTAFGDKAENLHKLALAFLYRTR